MKFVKLIKGRTKHAALALYLREGKTLDTCIGVAWGQSKLPVLCYRVGWGFDVEVPLRPWPVCDIQWKATHDGYWDVIVVWCGFYVGVSFSPKVVDSCEDT